MSAHHRHAVPRWPAAARDRRLDARHPAHPGRARGHRLVPAQDVRLPLHVRVVPGDAAPAALRPADGPRLEGADPGRRSAGSCCSPRSALGRTRTGTACVVGVVAVVVARWRCYALLVAAARRQPRATASEKGRCSDGLPRGLPRHARASTGCSAASGSRPSTRAVACRKKGKGNEPEAATTRRSPKPERLHGRHVLNRYEDGMEKCIGCELCAGVCPAKCIYVRGADNDPDEPDVARRALRLRLRDQLPALHPLRPVRRGLPDRGDHRVEAVRVLASPTARTRSTPRPSCVVDDDGKPQQLPWEDWREGEDLHTSAAGCGPRRRAATPTFVGVVGWSGELGYGVRAPSRQPDAAGTPTTRRTTAAGRRPPLMELFVFVFAAAMVLGGAVGVIVRSQPGARRAQPRAHAVRRRRALRRAWRPTSSPPCRSSSTPARSSCCSCS